MASLGRITRPGPAWSSHQSPSFTNPTIISSRDPLLGLHVPVLAFDPFLTQPAMRPTLGILVNPMSNGEHHDETFARAVEMLPTSPEEAGRLFTQVRDEITAGRVRWISARDDIFIQATFGSALWGPVTTETFASLREVRKAAKRNNDTEIRAREKLVRAVAHSRIGDDTSAMNVLKLLVENREQMKDPELRISVLIMYINLLVNRAGRYTGNTRLWALDALQAIMTSDLRNEIKELRNHPDCPHEHSALMESVSGIYRFVAEFVLEQHLPYSAREIIQEARALFPGHAAIEELFSREPPDEDGPSSREVSPLRHLLSHEPRQVDHLIAGVAEFLNAASFPNNREYWKHAAGGALLGALLFTAAMVIGGIEPSLAATMTSTAIGATALVAYGKARQAFKSPQVGQAFVTGYSSTSFMRAALKQALHLVGTYAFFGGAMPATSILPNVLLATDHGQLHGLGSLFSYVVRSAGLRAGELVNYVQASGLLAGVPEFWRHWVSTSMFAEAINNGLTLPFNHPIDRIFSNASKDAIPIWARNFSVASPLDAVRSMVLGVLYGWMGVSGLYEVASMNPRADAFLKKHIPDYLKLAMLPGAFLATSAAMVASGVGIYAAPGLVLFNYLIQHRHWVQGGGNWNIFRPGVLRSLPIAKYMTAGAVQLLYIGPGNAIKPHIPALSETGLGHYVLNNIEAHCGMVGFLAALGVFHAALTSLSVPQTLKAKYAKAWTWEVPANVLKLMMGWTSFWGNITGQFIKEIGFGAPVTNVFREAGGSQLQHSMVMGLVSGNHAAQRRPVAALADRPPTAKPLDDKLQGLQARMISNANMMHDAGVEAALRGEAYGFLNVTLLSQSIADQLLTITDTYFMEDDTRIILGPNLKKEWYTKIIYRALTDPATDEGQIQEYFDRLRVISMDMSPGLRHVRHNLLVTTMRAMAGAAHGDQIEEFFTEGPGKAMVEAYGLQAIFDETRQMKRNDGKNASNAAWPWPRPRKWIEAHLLSPNVLPEDSKKFDKHPADKFYDAAAVAGRRFQFSAPFTGRSLVENGAAFTSFLLAAAQGEPAFQTTVDLTFYAGTIYGILMTPTKKSHLTTEDYRSRVINPLLDLIENASMRLGDNRTDVRHNLLLCVWLASQGPHGELIRTWIYHNKALFQANGIYGMLKFDATHTRLPRSLKEKKLIKALFNHYAWNSENSADGMVVYPDDRRSPIVRSLTTRKRGDGSGGPGGARAQLTSGAISSSTTSGVIFSSAPMVSDSGAPLSADGVGESPYVPAGEQSEGVNDNAYAGSANPLVGAPATAMLAGLMKF